MDRIGIIICAYDSNADTIWRLARPLKDAGYYVVCGYDAAEILPDAKAVNSCDYFFTGGGHRGKQRGHHWAMQVGLGLLCDAHCNYVLSVTGDAIIMKPENIQGLIETLGGSDVIASQWNDEVGTMIFFGRTWPLFRALNEIREGPPQNEKKFHALLTQRNIHHVVHPCRADDRGIWGNIGYSRGNANYMP